MSGREDNTQHQKLKTKKLAIASVLICILGIIIIVLRIVFYRPWWSEYVARNTVGLLGIVGFVLGFVALRRVSERMSKMTLLVIFCSFLLLLCFLFLPILLHFISAESSTVRFFLQRCSLYLSVAFLLGLFAIPATRDWRLKSEGKLKEGICAILGMFLGVLFVDCWFVETCVPVSTAMSMACSNNLRQLGKSMSIYANNNGGCYPEPAQWCDLLLQQGEVERNLFFCPCVKWEWRRQVFPWPVPKKEKCYYAMNPNCVPNSLPDTVLLFETKGGWNRYGGPELMTIENHLGHCHILFNDGHIETVSRKRIPELNWGESKNRNNE